MGQRWQEIDEPPALNPFHIPSTSSSLLTLHLNSTISFSYSKTIEITIISNANGLEAEDPEIPNAEISVQIIRNFYQKLAHCLVEFPDPGVRLEEELKIESS